jgi:hypothetical protein
MAPILLEHGAVLIFNSARFVFAPDCLTRPGRPVFAQHGPSRGLIPVLTNCLPERRLPLRHITERSAQETAVEISPGVQRVV